MTVPPEVAGAGADSIPGAAIRHTYPPDGLWGEAIRAGLGIVLGGGLLAVSRPGSAVSITGLVLVLLFLAYAAAAWLRRRTVVTVDDRGVTAATGLPAWIPFGLGLRSCPWDGMTGLTLRYFSTRRDRSGGWMQLRLKGPQGQLTILSTIDGFPALARRAAAAAGRNGLQLGFATQRNLQALGRDPRG